MSEYTKGEWHTILDTDNRLQIMSKGKDGTKSINIAKMPVSPDAEANANLIAQAPRLVEVLEALLNNTICDICYEDNCGDEFSCTKGIDGAPCQCHTRINEAEINAYKVLSEARGE